MTTVAFMDEKAVGSFYAREGKCIGIVSRVETIDKEFGKYKVIYYIANGIIVANVMTGSAHTDIWRLSDGPEEFIGNTHNPLFASDYYARPSLSRFEANGNNRFDLEQEALDWLIEISERELEGHYNSLQFA